jgi:nucleotide-binding universal stress UspA family protein
MFKKILVALDRSSEAKAVLDSALSVSQPETTEMLLVHFIDWQTQDVSPWIGMGTLYDIDLSGERYSWSRQGLQTEVEIVSDWLKAIAEKAEERGVNCKYECHVGNCNLGIIDRTKNWRADVIVLGRRGHKNISEMFLGSVSNYVIHHAPCSVFVVQGVETSKTDEFDEFFAISEVNS